ncbi:MAG: TonB-dependent receptor [Halioglobus sp.]
MLRNRPRILSAAILSSTLISVSTLAQTPQLEEVLVTAEFRDVALQDQVGSTTIIGQDELHERAAQHLEDILNVAPNVNFASGASRARFFQIRGVGERSQFIEPLNPSIGVLVDGIDFSGLGSAGNLFDVDQVEILRGPQGTIHGANALAGLINIQTGSPEETPGLRIETMAADYDTYSAGIVGTGPLIADTLLYRLAINSYQSDGYIENRHLGRDNTNDRDETTIRGKLRWLSGENDTLDLVAMYADLDNGYDAFSLDNNRNTLSDQPGQDTLDSKAIGLNWQRSLRNLQLESKLTIANTDTDYGYDEDWSFVGIAPDLEYSSFDRYRRERDSLSAQVRVMSTTPVPALGANHDWVAGVYYLGEDENLKRQYTYLSEDFRSQYDTDTMAAYGQLDSHLTNSITLISGLRIERRETDYSDNNGVESDPAKNLWGGRLMLEYSVNDDAMLYGGISRGYRANGVNAGILSTLEIVEDPEIAAQLRSQRYFDDESLINYEIGLKNTLLSGQLQSRLTVFYMDRKDQQVKGSLVIPREDGSSNFIDYTSNAADGNNYGLEWEVNWQPTEALVLYANLGLLETEFENYTNAAGDDLSGREQAHAPSYQYAAGARLNLGARFYARVDLEGKDSFYLSDRHSVEAPSQDLLHARLGFTTQHWDLAVWGRNLTDEDTVVRGFGSFGNDPRKGYVTEPYFQYGEPRLVGISASYQF